MAADRRTPTPGSPTVQPGDTYADAVNEEVAALWNGVVLVVENIGGTANAITGEVTPTLDAYQKGQGYLLVPTTTNTGAVTLDIDARGERAARKANGSEFIEGELLAGVAYLFVEQGTELRHIGTIGVIVDLPMFIGGEPLAAEAFRIVFARAVTFPAGLTGSQAKAGTAADAEAVFSLQKNAVEFGTITFAAAGTTGTFAAASETAFAAGDVLTIEAPDPQDATLADIAVTLTGQA